METEKYYGYYFLGEGFDERKLCQTYFPVDQLGLDELLYNIKSYLRKVEFKVQFGFIKELIIVEGKIRLNSPSKVAREKLEAFIIKRKGDEITGESDDYFTNGKKLDMRFGQYEVSIFEIES